MTPTDHRRKTYRRGLYGEYAAAALLLVKGYRILSMRARMPIGEIDIVARRRRHFAFVEVKSRVTIDDGLNAISPHAQARLRWAAEAWLAGEGARGRLPDDYAASLDLIVVRPWRMPRHFAGAFGHELC